MNPLYPEVAKRAEFRCEYCHAPEQVFNFAFDVEHIHPRSSGGRATMNNLALACASCNLFKSNVVEGEDEIEQRLVSLFHPRLELWEENFVFDAENGMIHGLTATGRVTVLRLKMNSAFPLRARLQWILLGFFP